MLQRFKKLRSEVLGVAKRALSDPDIPTRLIESSGLEGDVRALENGAFTIAVVAPFSTGKSTFINALMGTDLLSMAVTAETAVVTRVRWGDRPRFRVEFDNGAIDEIPRRGQAVDLSGMKAQLRAVTTVKHETPGSDISASSDQGSEVSQVTVEWDIDLLRGGVEIVDTPGLFSRHSAHNSITRDVLPDAHAVIFLLEPMKLGEAHFTEEIRHYVVEAKNSNLDRRSRHIFFIINKLDECHRIYDKLVAELEASLEGILPQPRVLGVSSYYALASRRYQRHELTLKDLQRDNHLFVPDPDSPDDFLSGRLLEERHVPLLAEQSRIADVESALSSYLENRYLYIVENVIDRTHLLCARVLEELDVEEQAICETASRTREKYLGEIETAKKGIRDLEARTKDRAERVILHDLRGNNTDSVRESAKKLITARRPSIESTLREAFKNRWNRCRSRINADNAKAILDEINLDGERAAQTALKEMIKDVHGIIDEGIERTMENVRGVLESSHLDYTGILAKLGLKSGGAAIDVHTITHRIHSEIESQFRRSIKSIAGDIQGQVDKASRQSEERVRKPGFWNWVKSIFGLGEYDVRFDRDKFIRLLDDRIQEFANKYIEFLWQSVNANIDAVDNGITVIAESASREVEKFIDFELTNRRMLLGSLEQQLKSEQQKSDDAMGKKKAVRHRLTETLGAVNSIERACAAIRQEG